MNSAGKWTYSQNEESFCNDHFESRDDAILAGKEDYGDDPFYVGRIEDPGLGVIIDVDDIIETINSNMKDECGEWVEEYLFHTKPEHDAELEKELCDVVERWIKRHGYQPTFYKVVDVERVGEE